MLRAFLFIFTVGTCSVCAHWPSDPSGMSSLRQQATPLLASYAFFDHCCVYTIFFHHMSGESTSPAPRLCISKDEVYQALLDACIFQSTNDNVRLAVSARHYSFARPRAFPLSNRRPTQQQQPHPSTLPTAQETIAQSVRLYSTVQRLHSSHHRLHQSTSTLRRLLAHLHLTQL
jgi:hypothetical protein